MVFFAIESILLYIIIGLTLFSAIVIRLMIKKVRKEKVAQALLKREKEESDYYHLKKISVLENEIIKIKEKYSKIINLEDEIKKQEETINEEKYSIELLKKQYGEDIKIYKKLKTQIKILEEDLNDMDYGIYKPHFNFSTSEGYKLKLIELKEKEKKLIKDDKAAICEIEWTVGGSKTEGKKMMTKQTKLMLRAFNGECDAAIVKASWNNVVKMEERIKKAFEAINKMGETHKIRISQSYLDLKQSELRLTYEYEKKKHEENEEQKEIKARMREEEKAFKEAEKAREEAENEEIRYQKALEKAKEEIGQLQGEKLEEMKLQMARLEEELENARKMKERAISQAQLTKSGHVYIISNIGSFGNDVYKIGMTRRLEPMERVRELGDASVPFPFDVHAMIYSENAPELESALHREFNDRSVNLVNMRKEFFNVSLKEIEEAVLKNYGEFELTKLAEAQQYHETLSLRKMNETDQEDIFEAEEFPISLD